MGLGKFLNKHLLCRYDLQLVRSSAIIPLSDRIIRDLATQPSRKLQEDFLALAQHFSPKAAVGKRKIRLGRPNDGGYVMLDDFAGIAAAISAGIGDDASWDLDIAEIGIPTYQLDHCIASSPAKHPNLIFMRHRLVSHEAEGGETLAALIDRYGHGGEAELLLKMDIEGDEWPILDQTDADRLRQFAQIICEFHYFSRANQRDWYNRAKRVMEKLSGIFQVVHVHGNNCEAIISIGNVPFPQVLEVTFANRARYQFTDSAVLFPTPLDQPNCPGKADLFLGAFKFRT